MAWSGSHLRKLERKVSGAPVVLRPKFEVRRRDTAMSLGRPGDLALEQRSVEQGHDERAAESRALCLFGGEPLRGCSGHEFGRPATMRRRAIADSSVSSERLLTQLLEPPQK